MNDSEAARNALHLSLFASAAASVAIGGLVKKGAISEQEIDQLLNTLAICQRNGGPTPEIQEHYELLADQLTEHRRTSGQDSR